MKKQSKDYKKKQARNQTPYPEDFSEPWKFSDVVLVVEEQRFHVHQSTLAFWSPVFERMFTSDFKEKNSEEIPLPGKKASEVNELLQIMYPSLEEKVITRNSCYFLLDLAREYQIASITRKCENFLVSAVKTRMENDVIAVLIVGQNYELQTLVNSCVYEARRLSLKELKHHTKRRDIDPNNYMQIAERIMERLEKQGSEVKASCSLKLLDLSKCLYHHARMKIKLYLPPDYHCIEYPERGTIDDYLCALSGERIIGERFNQKGKSGFIPHCPVLSDVSKHLMELRRELQTLP